VKLLDPGSVEWEVEDEPIGMRHRGTVERVSRVYNRERDRSGGSNEGTIRLQPVADKNNSDTTDVAAGKEKDKNASILLRYTATNSNANGSHSRLNGNGFARNDIVEFTIVTDKRTKIQHARNITMIQSEHARLEEEREKQMLESATLEQGTVVTLKENFGFLRSNRRNEEVYFHYSHVVLPDVESDDQHTLAEGQDMEFLVVTEQDGERRKKFSGRSVTFLDKGSVVFQQVLAEGVTGILSKCPTPAVTLPGGGRNRRASSNGVSGKIQLDSSITFQPAEQHTNEITEETIDVGDVVLLPDDVPGGCFPANRDGSRVGMWVREGDTLLFDVIRDVIDGTIRAKPTKFERPHSPSTNNPNNANDKEGSTEQDVAKDGTKKVRIIAASLGGRSEGIISSIKDNYGFIQLADRNADAYFRLSDVLPSELQRVMMMNGNPESKAGTWNLADQPKLDIGCEVSFDLSLQPPQVNNFGGRGGHTARQQQNNDKEQVRAQRLALLPSSSVKVTRTVAVGIKAVVVKESPRQKGAGQLELETKVTGLASKERHPITARLLEVVRSKHVGFSVSFHDAQSEKDLQVIEEMIAEEEDLELRCVPMSSADSGERNLVRITVTNVGKKSEPVDPHSAPVCTEGPKKADASCETKENGIGTNQNHTPNALTKKLKTNVKSVNTLFFENHSLSSDFDGPPLGKGDTVTCDISQCCRTGAFSVSNIELIERNTKIQDSTSLRSETKSGMGFILEAIEKRQCGRISVFDENSSQRQVISFLYADVSFSVPSTGKSSNAESRKIRKGDEVTFDSIRVIDRKVLAKNVMVVPQGTIDVSNKLDKNQCQGYILMSPSHTSLAHKQSPSLQKGNEGGRWSNCVQEGRNKQSDETNLSGRILQLPDPGQSLKDEISEKRSDPDDTESVQPPPKDLKADGSIDTSLIITEDAVKNTSSVTVEDKTALYSHLSYSNASIRSRGTPRTPSMDIPKRGDLVSFSKGKGGKLRNICIVKANAATTITGTLEGINIDEGTANFTPSAGKQDLWSAGKQNLYQILLSEVVSCEAALLKKKESVEGIFHGGKVFGVCRTADLYLKSTSLRSGLKERPRLNLTVKRELKDMGGKIIAQSGMAKGPDGTTGFALGWTKRICKYSQIEEESTLDINSREFIPKVAVSVESNEVSVHETELSS